MFNQEIRQVTHMRAPAEAPGTPESCSACQTVTITYSSASSARASQVLSAGSLSGGPTQWEIQVADTAMQIWKTTEAAVPLNPGWRALEP